jgi:fructose-1,6-bisphosphatase I
MYPGTTKNPEGKLRLQYESNPLAFIVEQAGGKASDGRGRIMDIQPASLHQRAPLFIGSKNMVELVEKLIAEENS